MASVPRVRDEGGWSAATVVLEEEFEKFDAARPKWINGMEGSIHAPTGDIIIGGAFLFKLAGNSQFDNIVSAALKAAGTFTITNTAEMRVASGGFFLVQAGGLHRVQSGGELEVLSGGVVEWKSNSQAQFKGIATFYEASETTFMGLSVLTAEAGSAFNLSGDVTFADDTWPKLDPARPVEVHSLEICNLTYEAPNLAPADPAAWLEPSDGLDPLGCIRTRPAGASGQYHWIRYRMPAGSLLKNIKIATKGITGSVAATLPIFRVARFKGTGSLEFLSLQTDDAHTGANWTSTTQTTTVDVDPDRVVDPDYTYVLIVYHPFESGTKANMRVYDSYATCEASSLEVGMS